MKARSVVITESDFDRLNGLLHSRDTRVAFGPNALHLQSEIDRGKVVPPKKVPQGVVTMNSKVEYLDIKSGETETVTVVYPQEADIDEGRVSVLAPLGTALLGAKVGDTVVVEAPAGPRKIKIVKLLYQPESAGDYHL